MHYQIDFVPSEREQLGALPKDVRRLIGAKLDRAARFGGRKDIYEQVADNRAHANLGILGQSKFA